MSSEEELAIQQLGGFALGNLFGEIGLDEDAFNGVQSQLGIRRSTLDARQIYNDRFADDDLNGELAEDEDERDDLEAQVDREMYDEKWIGRGQKSLGRQDGIASGRVRGEDDDFDEDYDEEDEDQDQEMKDAQAGVGEGTRVKFEEDQDYSNQLYQNQLQASTAQSHPQYLAPNAFMLHPQSRLGQSHTETHGQEQELVQVTEQEVARPKVVDVKTIYPGFQKGRVLNFTELFKGKSRKRKRKDERPAQGSAVVFKDSKRARSTRDVMMRSSSSSVRPWDEPSRLTVFMGDLAPRSREQWEDELEYDEEDWLEIIAQNSIAADGQHWVIPDLSSVNDLADMEDWEERIVWDPSDPSTSKPSLKPDPFRFAFPNPELESGEWTKSIIWDEGRSFKPFSRLNLNLNDPEMGIEVREGRRPTEFEAKTNLPHVAAPRAVNTVKQLDPYNLSNDRLYDSLRVNRKKIRQTFRQLEVQHAGPALKLQMPFYKTRLSKADARSFHRPALQFPTQIPITFSKVRSQKKKKDKSGRKIRNKDAMGSEVIKGTSDLSLRDSGSFVLWEYSEEYPPILSNLGMGSLIVNYYRKKSATDEFTPELDIGEPFLLDVSDESPFMKFGSVEPGQTVPTLYNNMVRAPMFRHKASDTDFLVVRSTVDGDTKYFIRDIKNLYAVGQTYPLTEVPGPHSRKVTNQLKHRLQSIAFKLLKKSQGERIKIGRLIKYFPDQNELQMRQRLKEFMEYNRKGEDQGFWKLKPQYKILEQEEMLKLIGGPEAICLTESMQVGQRHLLDAGYGKDAEDEGKDEDESKLDIEQQLAPWITTKNFLNATQNKAMLKLHGEGDPTGRGEAFSFVRISMKDIFLRAGEDMGEKLAELENRPKSAHRYNVAQQQAVYRSEIDRIWKAQFDSLSSSVPPILVEEDEKARERYHGAADTPYSAGPATPGDEWNRRRNSMSPASSRGMTPDRDDAMSVGSRGYGGAYGANKLLKIRRLVDGEWKTEIIRDSAVISAYIRQRQMVEEQSTEAEALMPTDDAEKNKLMKKRIEDQLLKLRKNQERRLQRKNAKLGINTSVGPGGLKKAVKAETTRRCGNCGQIGHMKTSRAKCPRWAEFNGPNPPTPASATAGTSAGAVPPGLGGIGGIGFGAGIPTAHSPLATSTSPPAFDGEGNDEGDGEEEGGMSPQEPPQPPPPASPERPTPVVSRPKIKLSLGGSKG